jgi:hypothetical protein
VSTPHPVLVALDDRRGNGAKLGREGIMARQWEFPRPRGPLPIHHPTIVVRLPLDQLVDHDRVRRAWAGLLRQTVKLPVNWEPLGVGGG